jgi:hypothetical protein
MGMLVVSAVFVVILTALAYRANTRFRSESRLPMQWGITGAVNWSAPRSVALAFIPILAIGALGFQVFMAMNVPARTGQEGLVFPVLVGTGVTLVAVQLLHLWLIERTLRRNVG